MGSAHLDYSLRDIPIVKINAKRPTKQIVFTCIFDHALPNELELDSIEKERCTHLQVSDWRDLWDCDVRYFRLDL